MGNTTPVVTPDGADAGLSATLAAVAPVQAGPHVWSPFMAASLRWQNPPPCWRSTCKSCGRRFRPCRSPSPKWRRPA